MSDNVLFNGVSVKNEPSYLIYVKQPSGEQLFGVCSSKDDAMTVVRNVGRNYLRSLMTVINKKWTKISIVYDEENGTSYKINTQSLGRLFNADPILHTTVYLKEIQSLIASEYVEPDAGQPVVKQPVVKQPVVEQLSVASPDETQTSTDLLIQNNN